VGRTTAVVAAVAGLIAMVIAGVYFAEPAGSLPTFFPGYEAGQALHHTKHGTGAAVIRLALFALAWFQSKPRRAS